MKHEWLAVFSLTLAAYLFQTLPEPVTALLILMAIDVVMGIMIAIKDMRVRSRRLRDGLMKKIGVLLIISAAYALDKYTPSLIMEKLGDAATYAFVVTELVSILENAILLGIPLPPVLARLFDKRDEKSNGAQN